MMSIMKILSKSSKIFHLPSKRYQFYPEKLFDPSKEKFDHTLKPVELRDKLSLF